MERGTTFKVQVGPAQISIHHGRTVLACEPDGTVRSPGEKGLHFNDTRLVSSWSLYADGTPWDLLSGGATSHDALRIHLTNRALKTPGGAIPARTLGLVLQRSIHGGLHEDIGITNHGPKPVAFNLEIGVRCDFADVFEAKSGELTRRGSIATDWSAAAQRLDTSYSNADFRRSVTLRPHGATASYANGRLSFAVALPPVGEWRCCLLYDPGDSASTRAAPDTCGSDDLPSASAQPLAGWKRGVLDTRASDEEFYRTFHQAVDDMAALRLPHGGGAGMSFVPIESMTSGHWRLGAEPGTLHAPGCPAKEPPCPVSSKASPSPPLSRQPPSRRRPQAAPTCWCPRQR